LTQGGKKRRIHLSTKQSGAHKKKMVLFCVLALCFAAVFLTVGAKNILRFKKEDYGNHTQARSPLPASGLPYKKKRK